MCGRFFIAEEGEDELLSLMIQEASRRQKAIVGVESVARGEVRPSSVVAALAQGKNGGVGAFPMAWGFHLQKKLIINTRSETALQSPLFRPSMLSRRCLIPASCYFEWETRDGQRSFLPDASRNPGAYPEKIKYAIRPRTKGPMYLAGIYRYEEGWTLPVLSILTREAAPGIAFIHPRMPVIFADGGHGAWLDPNADPAEMLEICESDMAFSPA